MKRSSVCPKLNFLLLASLLVLPGALMGAVPVLKYRPTAGQTNVYSVRIEFTSENGVESLEGNLLLVPALGPSNYLTFTIQGVLVPKRTMPNPPMMSPRMMNPIMLGDTCEVQVDESGNVLRSQGDRTLQIPLGSVIQLLVHQFPARAESRWGGTNEAIVLDDPLGLGPADSFLSTQPFYYPGMSPRNGPAFIPGTRKVACEIKSATAESVVVSKSVTFSSRMQRGTEPRMSGDIRGDITIDSASGFMQTAESQFQSVTSTELVTRRTRGKCSIKLLTGSQRYDALLKFVQYAPQEGSVERKITPDDLKRIMTNLDSADDNVRRSAAYQLQNVNLDEASEAVLNKMTNLVSDPDQAVRAAASKIIADHGTTEQVPLLLKLLKDNESYNNQAIIAGLGRLKDPRAVEPLVAAVARGRESYPAVNALIQFGPVAEDSVLTLTKEKNVETLRNACSILKMIGTAKSLEPLKQIMLDPDQYLSQTAGEAYRAINSRL